MRVDMSRWEKHNVVERDGALRTREGLVSIKTPTAGTVHVGSFSIESPFTGEVHQHLAERDTTTGVCTLRVFTEEFFELYSVNLGVVPPDVVITRAVTNNQVMVNGPALAVPLYGLAAGGLVAAL
jgi:hypothetical protein